MRKRALGSSSPVRPQERGALFEATTGLGALVAVKGFSHSAHADQAGSAGQRSAAEPPPSREAASLLPPRGDRTRRVGRSHERPLGFA